MKDGPKRPLALIILDGWGYSPRRDGNSIALAHTPNYDAICERYPMTLLAASGRRVGLAQDAPGSSDVGHLNIGAGRIVKTDVTRIGEAIRSGAFLKNQVLINAFEAVKSRGGSVHAIGLLSDGEIHSSPETLFAILRLAKRSGVSDVFVHAILDGRDVMQRTADIYAEAVEIKMADIGIGRFATLCGRYYAMDRDANWDRTARAYTMLAHGEGERAIEAVSAIRSSFLRGITDEFVQPIVLEGEHGDPVAIVRSGDLVIFFNHRGDRIRQLVRSLAIPDETGNHALVKPKIDAICMTEYDRSFRLPVAFRPEREEKTLADVFAGHGIRNSRISEADRYAHITYFLNGGVEQSQAGEQRVILPSMSRSAVETAPELSCFKVTDCLLRSIDQGDSDVYIVNIAAPDMVAHTGSLEKTVESVQFVDTCLGGIVDKIREKEGVAIITSDHGNIEEMTDLLTGAPNNSHTVNQVPFHLIDENSVGLKLRYDGALEDVAPTLLGILGIQKPSEMTGRDLRELQTVAN